MANILYQSLPTEWNGYHINTGFHIGVQLSLLMDDETLTERMKSTLFIELLFSDEDGNIEAIPETMEELQECATWFLSGWNMDNNSDSEEEQNIKLMDYDVDQGRIYADFLHVYGIDLETTEMHWWKFQWLLWNMPHEQSSFLQVVGFRQEKPRKGASTEERKAITKRKAIYGLKQKKARYNKEQIKAIDSYDAMFGNNKE